MLNKAPLEKRLKSKKPLYQSSEAIVEANRCLYCYDAPCIKACPTAIDIPSFIKAIATGNNDQSAHVILRSNILGYSCARVCPVEVLCAGDCVMHARGEEAIQIGRLQHFAMHEAMQKRSIEQLIGPKAPATKKRVACVGAGPASIAVAGLLSLAGHSVEIFEARGYAGGLNATGIAPYKMHFDEAQHEIEWVRELGVVIHENSPVTSSQILLDEFDAVFLGLGIGDDTMLPNLPPSHPRIFGATDIIRRIKTDPNFSLEGIRSAHVIGGGNTAIDIARELAQLGVAEVTMVYRGALAAMSAYKHELESGLKEGVRILVHHQPTQVEATSDDRLRISFENKCIESDLLILAIGQSRLLDVVKTFDGIAISERGLVVVDKATQRTGHHKVWAGGDCTSGGKEVVNAVADAKIAAETMDAFLRAGRAHA